MKEKGRWRKYVLRELEKQYGDLDKIIPPLVNQGGQALAAAKLETSPITISRWLRANGYVQRVEWVKEQKAS